MKLIYRYWASILSAVFIVLLFVLAVRQLRYLEDMGEREKTRLRLGLSETAAQLARAIHDEFAALNAVFRIDERDAEKAIIDGEWNDFRHRWSTWKVYAAVPSIVVGFHILDTVGDRVPSRLLSWDGRTFAPDSSEELVASLSAKVHEKENERRVVGPGNGGPLAIAYEDILFPIDKGRRLWFIVRIDQDEVIHGLIPQLADRYLYSKTDYYFRILDLNKNEVIYLSEGADVEGVFAEPDVRYPLLSSVGGPPSEKPGAPLDSPSLPEIIDGEGARKQPILRPFWWLEAVHRSGSLSQVVQSETMRNSILSMGIIALLAASFVILALGVRRQQEFADRQNEFIATITHELKTPIAVIRAAADNLAAGVVRDQERTAVYGGTIKRESGRLANMIDRLLAYARLGDGSRWRFETIDLRPLATRVVNGYRAELEDARFEVDLSISESPVMIRGDTIALEFALGNLISNALKHARDGLYLGIDVHAEHNDRGHGPKGDWAVISVSDRGPGVSWRERKLIFESFYRGKKARKSQIPGSGIGLGFIRRVTEAHGGSIGLEGIGGVGSTFVVRLPLEVRNDGKREDTVD